MTQEEIMIEYILLKVRQKDWHWVSNAANDLREMQAKKEKKEWVGLTDDEEGMEVKLVYQKDRHTKKERYMVLAMNEAGHCCTRVDLIQLLDWVKINKLELINRPWVGLTDDEIWQAWLSPKDSAVDFARSIESKLRQKNHD
jgi:hypothetical protein